MIAKVRILPESFLCDPLEGARPASHRRIVGSESWSCMDDTVGQATSHNAEYKGRRKVKKHFVVRKKDLICRKCAISVACLTDHQGIGLFAL